MPSQKTPTGRNAPRVTEQSPARPAKAHANFRLRPEIMETLRRLAELERRSMTGEIEWLIEREAEAKGIRRG